MSLHNARSLTKSNAHFQKALKRLPLGVASTFRYWGDDRLGYGPTILDYADDRIGAVNWTANMEAWDPQGGLEPTSIPYAREPLFMCEAHDQSCLDDTLRAFEISVDLTLEQVEGEKRA